MAKERKTVIERLVSGETVKCLKCGNGIYKSFAKNSKKSHDFICNKCSDTIHLVPNVIVN